MLLYPWFKWNGVQCDTYGMHVLTTPSVVAASERATTQEIPGRSGTLTLLEGDGVYDEVTLGVTCIIDDPFHVEAGETLDRISKISAWLRGSGEVTFYNRTNGYYKGRVSNQISFDQIVRGNPHVSFQVQFRCEPYFYLNSGNTPITVTTSTSPYSLTNQGNIASAPLIRLEGTGEGTIMIGSSSLIVNSFEDIDYIMVDCDAKIAYKGEDANPSDPFTLLNTRVTGEWPKIETGNSFVTLANGITKAVITPRWRCIG